jgi:hypothetical protein
MKRLILLVVLAVTLVGCGEHKFIKYAQIEKIEYITTAKGIHSLITFVDGITYKVNKNMDDYDENEIISFPKGTYVYLYVFTDPENPYWWVSERPRIEEERVKEDIDRVKEGKLCQ